MRGLFMLAAVLLIISNVKGQDASRAWRAEWQSRINEYGRLWTMADGKLDLRPLDRFYAADGEVLIFDFAPPGKSHSWAEHRRGLEWQLFTKLRSNRFVPRQDVTVRLIGNSAAVTTFTFDYANEDKSGKVFRITGRQTNVWEKRGNTWVIVHEHGSPVPQF